jgi:hypothetical protein
LAVDQRISPSRLSGAHNATAGNTSAVAAARTTRSFETGGELPHHRGCGQRIQPDFTGVHFADALHDQVRRRLLQHDPATAELHRLHELILVFRSREHNHASPLVGLLHCLEGR